MQPSELHMHRLRFLLHDFDIYHWSTEYMPNHFLMTSHRRHIFKRKGTSQSHTWFCINWTFLIFMVFRFSHYWCENSESKLVNSSNNILSICIAGAFTKFAIFENRIYFKTRCRQVSCTCTRFRFFTGLIYNIEEQPSKPQPRKPQPQKATTTKATAVRGV